MTGSGGIPDVESVPPPDPKTPAALPADDPPTTTNGDPDGGATRVLAWLLSGAFLTHLHQQAGEPAEHPLRGQVCFAADFVMRLLTYVIMLGIVVLLAAKLLLPLPGVWQP